MISVSASVRYLQNLFYTILALYIFSALVSVSVKVNGIISASVLAMTVHGRQQLRSGTLLVPHARTATGQRSFAINEPRTWNSLPADLRTPDTTLCSIKRHLKSHLFRQ